MIKTADEEIPYTGRGFLYVLVLAGPEDLLKVGMTHDPLSRWSAFHSRWHEVFDLETSLLLETETRKDSQALETTLHRLLREHNCPIPMTMRLAAGGATEWYRGAQSTAIKFVTDQEQRGYVVHRKARRWLEPAMKTAQQDLVTIVQRAFEDQCAGLLRKTNLDVLRDLVDSHRAFGLDIHTLATSHVLEELGLM